MKQRIFVVLMLIFVGAALVWYLRCRSVGSSRAEEQYEYDYGQGDDNNACVGKKLTNYSKALRLRVKQLLPNLDEAAPQEENQKLEIAPEKFIGFIKTNDRKRQELTCNGLYLPFKIDQGNIQPYPSEYPACPSSLSTHPPSSSQVPPPTPTPLPSSVQENIRPILELAKSVGRLGIRPAGSQGYPTFWGTGFLVASSDPTVPSDVIITTCHAMDPIMAMKHKKHHLHLDGEELLIDFKWSEMSIDRINYYDYQCPVKDVLACSSQPGVDVALLYFDKDQCKGTGTLPRGAKLDPNEPHPTVTENKDKYKQDKCALSVGNNCMAMIAYADIDHPIDAPTNNVYRVYQDRKYSDFQFVMNDDVAAIGKCEKEPKVEIMMDIATTTVGESGGVLTYLNTNDGPNPANTPLIVSGMHTCCSAFFNYDGEIPPASDTACARLRRTIDNQAISTWSMLHDPDICGALEEHNALPQGYTCPK